MGSIPNSLAEFGGDPDAINDLGAPPYIASDFFLLLLLLLFLLLRLLRLLLLFLLLLLYPLQLPPFSLLLSPCFLLRATPSAARQLSGQRIRLAMVAIRPPPKTSLLLLTGN